MATPNGAPRIGLAAALLCIAFGAQARTSVLAWQPHAPGHGAGCSDCAYDPKRAPTALPARAWTASPADPAKLGQGISGTASSIGIEPFPLVDFGETLVGSVSAARAVTLTNLGTLPVMNLTVGVLPPFELVSNACPDTLAADTSCVVSVRFAPVQPGQVNQVLEANADRQPPSRTTLTGTGIAPPPAARPAVVPTLGHTATWLLALAFVLLAAAQLRRSA